MDWGIQSQSLIFANLVNVLSNGPDLAKTLCPSCRRIVAEPGGSAEVFNLILGADGMIGLRIIYGVVCIDLYHLRGLLE